MNVLYFILLAPFLSGFFQDNRPVEKIQIDGPYVVYKNDLIYVQYIYQEGGIKLVTTDSFPTSQKKNIDLRVATDEPGKYFTVKLKNKLINEKSEFGKPVKLLAISDIEANFKAFRTLLQANGVIDQDFNWTYGRGEVVFTGDFFDRGSQQNEVLWLMYALEEKAREAKGYVHFVLGNHEIMNMNGDFRYVHPRYMEHSKMMNVPYISLYWDNTELGRWLRTKNIAQRIGDILFVHGGISSHVNYMNVTAPAINELAKPFYPDTTYNYPDIWTEILFSDLGPFWYRGYYSKKAPATSGQVDTTLNVFGVKYITTGHTVVADTISVLYNGRVFNTDVYHAGGNSEAMLVEGGKFYRVNSKGEKFLMR